MAVFWVVAPWWSAIALMMEAASTSETLVHFYKTTRRYNPEDSHLHDVTVANCNATWAFFNTYVACWWVYLQWFAVEWNMQRLNMHVFHKWKKWKSINFLRILFKIYKQPPSIAFKNSIPNCFIKVFRSFINISGATAQVGPWPPLRFSW
jgi:hypothetical protein